MANIIRKILTALLLATACLFCYLAYQEHKPFEDAKVKQEAIKEAVVTITDSDEPLDRRIDFAALKEINPDIIGWLYIPQIGLDQPILQGQDDVEYLDRDFEGNDNPLGSVFTWAHADATLTDSHICLFAHNMWTGQMFGNLSQFQEEDFVEKNRTFYIYTPERTKELQIISVFECHKTDDVFRDDWEPEEGTGCQTVTLATCSGYDATPYRLTVNGEVVREKILL